MSLHLKLESFKQLKEDLDLKIQELDSIEAKLSSLKKRKFLTADQAQEILKTDEVYREVRRTKNDLQKKFDLLHAELIKKFAVLGSLPIHLEMDGEMFKIWLKEEHDYQNASTKKIVLSKLFEPEA